MMMKRSSGRIDSVQIMKLSFSVPTIIHLFPPDCDKLHMQSRFDTRFDTRDRIVANISTPPVFAESSVPVC